MYEIKGRLRDDGTRFPIKIWLDPKTPIEPSCLEQALNLADLKFLHQWVVLLPDVHTGYGMPIGAVIAAMDHIIPNAVGKDIGCGVVFFATDLPAEAVRAENKKGSSVAELVVKELLKNIPVGFEHHKSKQESKKLDELLKPSSEFYRELIKHPVLAEACFPSGWYQLGTLGSGNHFIELQEDEQGMLCVMLHSGSRNLGLQICDYFDRLAAKLNQEWKAALPKSYQLAYLPVECEAGQSYIAWMNMALTFAQENRRCLKERTFEVLREVVRSVLGEEVSIKGPVLDVHHNYASLEFHYGREVWVHRKGAIKAGKGEKGIVPGAMGSYSYVVEGLGNPESFCSSSHGAGRRMGRRQALKTFTRSEVEADLALRKVVIGKPKLNDIADESRFAYKDVEEVIAQELDLIKPVKKLKTVAVVKG